MNDGIRFFGQHVDKKITMALTEGKQIHFIGLSPNDYGRLCEYWKEVDPVAAKKTLEIYRQRLLVVSSWFSEVTILESAPSEYGLWRREEGSSI